MRYERRCDGGRLHFRFGRSDGTIGFGRDQDSSKVAIVVGRRALGHGGDVQGSFGMVGPRTPPRSKGQRARPYRWRPLPDTRRRSILSIRGGVGKWRRVLQWPSSREIFDGGGRSVQDIRVLVVMLGLLLLLVVLLMILVLNLVEVTG